MRKGQWTVLPASLTCWLKGVRISPVGIVHQRDRRPHTIVDYSFYDINEDTAPISPNQSMQFGRALHHILCVILEENPCFGPVCMCKIYIIDGVYRVWLLPTDIPKLGVVLPTKDDEEPLIGFHLALPMG
jgi:hypothetical protein